MLLAVQSTLAQPGLITLAQGELLISDSATPPVSSAGWQTVTLPDQWPQARYASGDNGWYRFDLAAQAPTELWGVYLPRLNMNAAVYFNGVPLGNGGSFREPLGRNWSRPLYFAIPPSLWQPEGNALYIRLKSYVGYGVLGRPMIGPDETLSRVFNSQQFWQVSLAKALFLVLIAISLFMLGIWRKRRKDSMYFWFALTTLSWSLLALNIFIREVPLSEKWWDTLMYSNIAWWTVFVAVFSYRFANIAKTPFEAAYALWAAGSTISYVFCDVASFPKVTFVWQMGSPIIGFIVIFHLLRAWLDTRDRAVAALALGITLIQLAGIYTFLAQSLVLSVQQQIVGHVIELASPILLLIIAWHLTGRFVRALNESERLNAELEARVTAKSRELEASYKRLAALERQQAVVSERERIHRDLHDDVGAKLLSLTYRSKDEESFELARSALQDLRDVVSRSARDDLSLPDALADWHAETDDRLEAAGIRLEWRQCEDLPDRPLLSQQSMNIGRILREAVSNIIRHARAANVAVKIERQDDRLLVTIENDGHDSDVGAWRNGRGTRNMRLRAELLGGGIHWEPGRPGGCRIRWWFPFNPPAADG